MTIITAVLLCVSWAASTFVGFGIGITYAMHSDRAVIKALSDAIIRVEMGHD